MHHTYNCYPLLILRKWKRKAYLLYGLYSISLGSALRIIETLAYMRDHALWVLA